MQNEEHPFINLPVEFGPELAKLVKDRSGFDGDIIMMLCVVANGGGHVNTITNANHDVTARLALHVGHELAAGRMTTDSMLVQ